MVDQQSSIDYKISSVSNGQDLNEVAAIRNKNQAYWQTKIPKSEVRLEISFPLSKPSLIDIKNRGTPCIEIKCFEKNQNNVKLNEFTCLAKTILYDPTEKDSSLIKTSENSKTLNLSKNNLFPKLPYNGMEIILSNPHHNFFPKNLGLTYLILFGKKENSNEKIPPSIKLGSFFDSSNKKGSPFDTSKFSTINYDKFKVGRYNSLLNNGADIKKDYNNNILSLINKSSTDKSVKASPISIEKDALRTRESDLNRNSSNRKSETNFSNYKHNNYDKKFEDDLKKALEESIKTFEDKKTIETYIGDEYCDIELIDMETENIQNPSKEGKQDVYKAYKTMIYENNLHENEGRINENSMFPLFEDDLSQTYLTLEKISKK